jgi:hypothetical protein
MTGGLGPFPLGLSGGKFNEMVKETTFEGLAGGVSFNIIFTAVGIAFLLSQEISFSTWIYKVAGFAVILVLCWMGYGANHGGFPTNWLDMQNPVTAQGAGGILLFSTICLYRAIKAHVELGRGKCLRDRIRIAIPVLGLAISMIVVTLWMFWNLNRSPELVWRQAAGHLFWAAAFVAFFTLITLGLMRIVCEGGVFWFQSHASFFHFWKALGLGQWLSPSLAAAMLAIYSVLFLDIKTFIAPNLANAAKMRQDIGVDRVKFQFNLILCIAVSVLVSVGASIFLAYLDGAQKMNAWFYSMGPPYILGSAQRIATGPVQPEWNTLAWMAVGVAWIAFSVLIRRSLFWFPHPIGYIMLINPLMGSLWFSFFIGWLLKMAAVKYGGKATYDRLRDACIGLIMGEIAAIFLWNAAAIVMNMPLPGISLNRYEV